MRYTKLYLADYTLALIFREQSIQLYLHYRDLLLFFSNRAYRALKSAHIYMYAKLRIVFKRSLQGIQGCVSIHLLWPAFYSLN